MAGELFGWPQLNAALAEHRLSPPRLRLERAGGDASKGVFSERRTRRGRVLQDLDAAALNARLREGATLILDAANELSAPLQALCSGLAAELTGSCQANLYAAWGATQGFDIHWDDHDVFVVQVDGRKRWALYGFTDPAPTYRQVKARPKPGVVLDEFVLEAGEMLYLPRGYWHAAVGLDEPSLHLTIGVTRKTGSDFLHWLAKDALVHEAVRRDLPLEGDDARLGEHIAEVLTAALAGHAHAELGRRYRLHVEGSTPQRPALSLPAIGREDEDLPPHAQLRLADGPRRIEASAGAGAFVLRHRAIDYTLHASLLEPVTRLAGGETLTPAEFEAGTEREAREHALAFVREMLGRGVFVLKG
jgi:hypothetical protein